MENFAVILSVGSQPQTLKI